MWFCLLCLLGCAIDRFLLCLRLRRFPAAVPTPMETRMFAYGDKGFVNLPFIKRRDFF